MRIPSGNIFVIKRKKMSVWINSNFPIKDRPLQGTHEKAPLGANKNKPPALPGVI